MRLGGLSKRPTTGRRDGFRGGTSDSSQCEPRLEAGEEQHQAVPPCARDLRLEFEEAGLPTFNSPQANLGVVLAHLQQADPSPEVEEAMAYVRVATTLVEKSATSKSAASTSS
jgi:hypothetical protein